MNPVTLASLATAFAVVGSALGIPSLAVLVLYAANEVRLRLGAPAPATHFGDNPDAIVMMLQATTGALSLISRFVGSLLQFVFDGLAVVAAAGLVLGIACWCTSRGLRLHAGWARASAGTLLVAALLPSLLLALSLQGFGRVAMVLVVALCVLGLHAVWAGAGPQLA